MKRAITQSKPPSAQLTSCIAALERANARKERATVALAAAQEEVSTATQQVVHLESECQRLQQQISAQTAPRHNSLESLSNSLKDVLDDMQSAPA
eukprot:514579-Karenia_brevis.AAC.1